MPFEGIIQSAEHTAAPNASGLKRAAQQAGRRRHPGPQRYKKGRGRKQKEREDGRERKRERKSERGATGFNTRVKAMTR
jgi:hypothetical protein